MTKVKLQDNYPGFSLTISGVVLNKGDDFTDIDDSTELDRALSNDYVVIYEKKEETKEIKEGNEIWVYAETHNAIISKVTLELLGKAQILADKLNVKIACVLVCDKKENLPEVLFNHGADIVYAIEHPLLKKYSTDLYTKVITDLIKKQSPQIVMCGGTLNGRDLAPRIAKRINTGLTADCTELDVDEDGILVQTKPAFGDNVMAEITCPVKRPQMTTVRPGVFKIHKNTKKGKIINIRPDIKGSIVKIIEEIKTDRTNLDGSEIIIAGGRGLCNSANAKLLEEISSLLGAGIGASRAAVDAGWITKDKQIGQTGLTVQPRLYIACGISGAIQHVTGMQNSGFIVAVNKDPNALIFQSADYCIVADLSQFLPALISKLKK
ncbi:MAG: electron transfer flavoprotein subunit alpha/FixB family protein [Nanoarchaeota archaeon]